MSAVYQRWPSAEPLETRLEFEALLAEISSKFINLPPGEVDREIEDALRRVCELLAIDLAVLWQWSDAASDVITPTHVYDAQGRLRPSEPMRQEHYPWCRHKVLAGAVFSMATLEELPPEAAVDRETFRQIGIKSALGVPLSVGGEALGCLGLNTLREPRDWPDALVHRLQLVAQVFANALARRRHELKLHESEQRLRLAADSAGAGLWTLDYSTGLFWVTDRARAIFGYLPREVVSLERLQASVHPDDWSLVQGAIERSARRGDPIDVEYRIRLQGHGGVRWVASRGRPHVTGEGEPVRLMGVCIDITERRRGEEALRRSEARLESGADLAGLAFYEVDFADRITFLDDRVRDIWGVPPEREHGLEPGEFWMEHLHPDDRARVLDLRDQLNSGRLEQLSIEYRFLHPTSGEKWIQHLARVARRDATGKALQTFGVFRDITESKRFEDELRDLSQRLIRAHEEERALLARELHDDVTQRLAVLAIEVGRAESAAAGGPTSASMRALREELVRLSEDVHSLAYQLHPSVLDELGLAEALRAECERRRRRTRLDFSTDFGPLPVVLGRDAGLCLFRVAQEALSNVVRHSGARAASVTLRQMEGGLLLAVHDDGVGFDPASAGTGRHLGLVSMRERVRLVNGTLDVESARGLGTTVVAWVPQGGESP